MPHKPSIRKEDILNAFQFRHACKEFDPAQKITEEDFAFILETARLSPSSFGFEPWKFVVLQNEHIREKLRAVSWGAQKTLPTASHFVLILSRVKQSLTPESDYIQHIMKDVHKMPPEVVKGIGGAYTSFIENEFKLNAFDELFFQWASRQSYIALGNMVTAAAMIGVDSCPIEGFDKGKAEAILKEEGILIDDFGLSCFVAFGYRAQDPHRPKSRQQAEDIIHWV
ncbi:NAD(P)H-dependent oxidoreductase [Bacillus mesophilum]|uniref:NAD(P)H-dependent oxidoreductase n=1 Tax=Bacillus mesophilum TaxID=1071718 RepID=UPI001863D6F8|nr:NAD(P)H-dependent oxidoreductase [Bacillus mesophilum]